MSSRSFILGATPDKKLTIGYQRPGARYLPIYIPNLNAFFSFYASRFYIRVLDLHDFDFKRKGALVGPSLSPKSCRFPLVSVPDC